MNPDCSPHRSTHLFVYGTLLFDEVVRGLTDRTFHSFPATLSGFSRHAIVRNGKPEAYPAIRPAHNGTVAGRLLLDVDSQSMEIIDCFENNPPDYEQRRVEVQTEEGNIMAATTYVALPNLNGLLQGEWNREDFEQYHLSHYLTHVIPELRRQYH